MSNSSLEIVHEGWLTKSPPSKPIWRARWRRRWFVLRHSGELPDQYFLEYYTDRNCRKLKGKIDLDQCEQVDAGLRFENRKQKYQNMFDVKTPKRIYYLAAESEDEMNKWVEYVCHVCGLKAYKEEGEGFDYGGGVEEEDLATMEEVPLPSGPYIDISGRIRDCDDTLEEEPLESPPVSPTSTISGPYIPISECISGKPLNSPHGLEHFNSLIGGYGLTATTQYRTSVLPVLPAKHLPRTDEFYDCPRRLGSSPPRSPTTDGESVFTDDEWSGPVFPAPAVNWETFPEGTRPSEEACRPAPPRPPKPSHLAEPPSHIYLNVETVMDETYDFPRSHRSETLDNGHCYTNAAPSQVGLVSHRSYSPRGGGNNSSQVNVFRYDFHDELGDDCPSSATAIYCNLPSPLDADPPAPVVDRGLKPGRKLSDSASIVSEPSPGDAPSVDRKLKPLRKFPDAAEQSPLQLATPPLGRSTADNNRSLRKARGAPSPQPHNGRCSDYNSSSDDDPKISPKEEDIYYYQEDNNCFVPASQGKRVPEIKYLDLDLLDTDLTGLQTPAAQIPKSPERGPPTSTVYKTVDFLKTVAFNQTRKEVEEERKQCSAEL